jgi:hypothetical protein
VLDLAITKSASLLATEKVEQQLSTLFYAASPNCVGTLVL